MKILVVEDDPLISITLKHLLSSQSYAVDTVADGQAGWEMAEAFEYDLIVLDIKLPKLNGIDLCQQLRARGYRMPILMLTGIDDRQEKAIALNTGADDYVVKPFDSIELLARVQALLRRGKVALAPVLEWGNLRLDPSKHEVTYKARPLSLTPLEYALLELFLRDDQRVWSQAEILARVWASDRPRGEETVRYHIKELRRKLQAVGAPFELIETVYGFGYRLNPVLLTPIEPPVEETRPTVLVVTSDLERLASIERLLESQPLNVMALTDCRQYWQILEDTSIDLLIVDVELTPTNGIELCRSTRQAPRWQRLPIIALIPAPETDRIEQVFSAGADDFVSQPLVGPELIGRIIGRLPRGPS
jgi:DNA-binding response OmpR family regulator